MKVWRYGSVGWGYVDWGLVCGVLDVMCGIIEVCGVGLWSMK